MDAKDRLDVENAPERKKNLARLGFKVPMGEEQKEGWSGKLPFYLFICPNCGEFQKDYPHSWPETQYLWCDDCKIKISYIRLRTEAKMFFSFFGLLRQILRFKCFPPAKK
ncbi:hypothetical protein A2W39_00370 [Candidatus Azambacteria bacterium RIFCSPHIGHO2_01_46_10]|uniref:Uncharacterized protein n=1 Tax=Candidatus Azambacteria bacterium RIFCSPHIGHO2_01_46_10 TaxID=1797293 RepID=A0A1F5BYA9_9BACT|nr:MAG: hypothetical protein A2W39_00370 [Candidatus Azambacteria bacterium RIFCSPHIGHO2_01_46_10]